MRQPRDGRRLEAAPKLRHADRARGLRNRECRRCEVTRNPDSTAITLDLSASD